jgi:pimeloyl-ACP methyl ester carboxylesterase
MAQGPSAEVIAKYNDWLSQQAVAKAPANHMVQATTSDAASEATADTSLDKELNPDLPSFKGSAGSVRFTNLKAHCDDLGGTALTARSGQSLLSVDFEFMADPQLPIPNLALVIYSADGKIVCSTGTWVDGASIALNKRILASNRQVNLLHRGFLACDRYAGGLEAVKQLSCPLLFVLGQVDQMTPPKAAQGLIDQARATGKAVQVSLVPVGHHEMGEAPEATLAALRGFLDAS